MVSASVNNITQANARHPDSKDSFLRPNGNKIWLNINEINIKAHK